MRLLIPTMLLLAAGAVNAADAVPHAARLAATCAACHGTNGATVGTALPRIAGQGQDVLLAKLRAFKDGSAQGTIMTQIAKGYTDEQLEQLAAWFAAQSTRR
ncbi:c-type cytochrome [Massilia sp. SM-13]|uniref:c-type cytochrome n=1 Tax=Pseudoduganella rhizocola TaxID=3382643 RepID=UPI0038B5BDC1